VSYRDWQRQHLEWPKKLNDLVGRTVWLTECVQTNGGEDFHVDEALTVSGTYRGTLHLEGEKGDDGRVRALRILSRRCVTLLPPEGQNRVPSRNRRINDVTHGKQAT
jgi:hypothetical protein